MLEKAWNTENSVFAYWLVFEQGVEMFLSEGTTEVMHFL